MVGCLLITLLRHADRVRIACLAQLVNVIPAIRTLDGGPAWRQASFYPFADVARLGRGTVLRLELDGPAYLVSGEGRVQAIEAVAVQDVDAASLTVFAVNRLERALTLEASFATSARWSSTSIASWPTRTSTRRTRPPIPTGSCRAG